MKIGSVIYVGIYSLIWLYSIAEHIKLKEKIWFILLSIISGVLIIGGIVLYWPESVPSELKQIWKYVFFFIMFTEGILLKYEMKILEKKELFKDKDNDSDFDFDFEPTGGVLYFSIGLAILLIAPGIYYNFIVAFG